MVPCRGDDGKQALQESPPHRSAQQFLTCEPIYLNLNLIIPPPHPPIMGAFLAKIRALDGRSDGQNSGFHLLRQAFVEKRPSNARY